MKVIRTIQGAKFAAVKEPQDTGDLVKLIKADPWRWLQRVEVVDIDVNEKLTAEEKRFVAAGLKGCFPLNPFDASVVKREMSKRKKGSKVLETLNLPSISDFEEILNEKPKKSTKDESKDQDNDSGEPGAVSGASGAADERSITDGPGEDGNQPSSKGDTEPDQDSGGLSFEAENDGSVDDGSDPAAEPVKPSPKRRGKRGKAGNEPSA